MHSPNFEPLHSEFGAKVTGLCLGEELSAASVSAIERAIDDYSFLWFPDQLISDDMQLAFTQSLGDAEPSHVKLGQEGIIEYFITIGNVQDDGSVFGNEHPKTRFLTGNNMWHSDSSFRKVPSRMVPDGSSITTTPHSKSRTKVGRISPGERPFSPMRSPSLSLPCTFLSERKFP